MTPQVSHILIEDSIRNHPFTAQAISAQSKAQSLPPTVSVIADKDTQAASEIIRDLSREQPDLVPYDLGKEILVLKTSRGQPFRVCPGATTPEGKRIVCCNYHVFNFLSGCAYNCTYCYLRSYLNQPALSMQVDIEEPVQDLMNLFRAHPKQMFRVGTGEIADSLALPASDPLNRFLVESFSQQENVLLEFKTKSARVDSLLDVDSRNRVIFSWSLSPPSIANREELDTAPVEERILAAKRALAHGYQVAFHLDPLIFMHPNMEAWQNDYQSLIELLFDSIPPAKITWLSVGGLRLIKGLRESMMERFPENRLAYQEFVPSADGKLRYPKPLRRQMFKFIAETIEKLANQEAPPVYLCMETREIWDRSLGSTPGAQEKLRPLFHRSLPAL